MRFKMLLAALTMASAAFAQFSNSYFEQRLVQGINKSANLTVSLPSVSSALHNTGFTYGDIYERESKILNIVTAADADTDFNFVTNQRLSYGGVSVQKNDLTLSLHHEWSADASLNIPESLFDVVVDGNAQFANTNFTINPSFQYLTMHRISLGLAYSNARLHLGGQLHIYQGDESIFGKQFEINVIAQEDFFDLTFEKEIAVLSSGVINYKSIDDIDFIGNKDVFSPFPTFKNLGLGLALEGSYQVSECLKIMARVDDLGIINWRTQTAQYTDNTQSNFSGIDIRDSYVSNEPYSLKDTLYDLLSIEKSFDSFSETTAFSYFARIQYELTDNVNFGATLRGKQTATALHSVLQLHAQKILTDDLSLSVNNTSIHGSIINLGLGVNWRVEDSLHVYFNTTNPWKLFKMYDAKVFQLNFGSYITL